MKFHRRCGDRVTLLNDNSTAVRNFVEFNHGLILSAEPLIDDMIFEVSIDKKVNVWNGSLEIGVTILDPEYMELPATATKLRNTAWIMSGNSVVKDGITLVDSYGPELDGLREGETIGVMRTSKGELMFYINGRCLGVAARDMPMRLFAVIDLYGQCVQVSITNACGLRPVIDMTGLDQVVEDPNNDDTMTSSDLGAVALPSEGYPKYPQHIYVPMSSDSACALVAQDRLRFHPRCGILVKLSANNKIAERARPLDDYNNGVIMTHRPLYDNELFEIRIDTLVDKWSGSIEVGVTTHNPATIRFPSTMTNMDSGTIMMSGCKVLVNGHGTCREYGNVNLDELKEQDTVGLMRKGNGQLHYYINGVDQGVAADRVEQQVWGVIDLYGMTVKVSIVDPCEDSNIANAPPIEATPGQLMSSKVRLKIDEDTLLFHTLRDSNVIIINDGKTAHRPNAFEHFNNGIVMTNRTLKTNELFQVRLDLVIPKWAGSIEIGVTQLTADDIQLPFKMSSAKSGTWAITGEDVIRDGCIIIPQYVRNLNRLVEGDTVGVMRKDMGILHFFVNGVDQGPAAFNIPEHVFGIIDLYGRVAQTTIVDYYMPPLANSPDSPLSTESNATVYPEMCFHRVHGRNARLNRNRLTATRATVYSEFNDAVLFSCRPLRECDMFELRIDKMVDCWIGSLEIGVTAIRPDDLEGTGGVGAIAGTATDLNWDTYILSGAAMMKDGECVRSGYPLDLDTLIVGSRVGMMWHADRSLHYYLDGMDMGKAWYVPHLNIYAVVDLYGQCTQVTILQNEERAFNYNGCPNLDNSAPGNIRALTSPPPPYWSFSEYCGDNVCLVHEYRMAKRLTPDPMATLVFSSTHLAVNELFEIKIIQCKHGYAGSFRMGVTDVNILNAHVNRCLPPSISFLPHYTAYIDGNCIKYSKPGNKREHEVYTFVPSFEWVRPGDKIGLKKTSDSKVLVYYNSEQLEISIENVPDKVFAVMELYGAVTKICAVSQATGLPNAQNSNTIPNKSNGDPSSQGPDKYDEVDANSNDPSVETVASQTEPEEGAPGPVQVTNEPSTSATDSRIAETNEPTTVVDTVNASETVTVPAATASNPEPRRRKNPLPYTFHHMHGKNIKLCSSDTVAVRTASYKYGIAVISQPLQRGQSFRFRVDKIDSEWMGSVAIGAVGHLPTEPLPPAAVHLYPPVWVLTTDLIYDNGEYMNSTIGSCLETVSEESVLTLYFGFNNDLIIDVNNECLGVIATAPRNFNQIFPLIDLYGQVRQVSVMLYPHIFARGTSIDLPIITEYSSEEYLDECEVASASAPPTKNVTVSRKPKSYSHDNLNEDNLDPMLLPAGPSTQTESNLGTVTDERKQPPRRVSACPNQLSLHQSFIAPHKVSITERDPRDLHIHKSRSSHDFDNAANETNKVALRQSFSTSSGIADEAISRLRFYDTNIRHNDRYPEANDVDDNLDNEIMDALTLETGNLPDLTEEQSSSIDESTRRDEIWSEQLSAENLNYLNRILCLEQDVAVGQNLEAEWEVSGENCEHLHLVLKYWNFLVCPYPELRRAVSWGQVRCYCSNCQPDSQSPLADWVRIERIDGVGAAQRGFWHVSRSTLASAQGANGDTDAVRRPRALAHAPYTSTTFSDIWFDEEGKPHHTLLAIEIDIEGSEPENDRLLAFLIHLKSHSYLEENPPSIEE